jgi:hypothetical protein
MSCWPLPVQSFSGPSPLGLETIFYCLTFETSIFVASYNSQGHGGCIRPRLHTGVELPYECPLFYNLGRTDKRPPARTVRVLLCYYLCFFPLLRNVPRDLLHSSGGPTVDCLTSEICLPNRCLATVIFITVSFLWGCVCCYLS